MSSNTVVLTDHDELFALLSGTREKGIYKALFEEFLESGDKGWDVTERFAGKKLLSVSAAMRQNVTKHAPAFDAIRVIYKTNGETDPAKRVERLVLANQSLIQAS